MIFKFCHVIDICLSPVTYVANTVAEHVPECVQVEAGRVREEVEREGDGGASLNSSLMLPAWEPDQSIPRAQSHLQRTQDLVPVSEPSHIQGVSSS